MANMEYLWNALPQRMRTIYNFGNNSEYYIFVCSHCGHEKRVRKEPLTSMSCTWWSDGKIECCNDWQISYMQRCPHCGKYFYIVKENAKTGYGSAPEDDGCLEIGEYASICSNKELMSSLPPEDMASLFMQYVQQYNDVYRRGALEEKRASYQESRMFTEAILFLAARCRIPGILIADLYRQAGMFRKCLEYAADIANKTNCGSPEDFETLDRTRFLAIKGDTVPFVTRTIIRR